MPTPNSWMDVDDADDFAFSSAGALFVFDSFNYRLSMVATSFNDPSVHPAMVDVPSNAGHFFVL